MTIKNALGATAPFLFNEVSLFDIEKELSNLTTKKSSTFKTILEKILKVSWNSCSEALKTVFIQTVLTGNELKLADITPVFTKGNWLK